MRLFAVAVLLIASPSWADATAPGANAADKRLPRMLNGVCKPRVLPPAPRPTPAGGPEHYDIKRPDECAKHSDCKAKKYGRCVRQPASDMPRFGKTLSPHNACEYDDCMSDAECRATGGYEPKDEQICQCGGEASNRCGFGNCRVEADCPAPFTCGAWGYCHQAKDSCQKDADCKAPAVCQYDWSQKRYACKTIPPPPPG